MQPGHGAPWQLANHLPCCIQVTKLNLDGVRATNITGLTDEFTSLRELSLNGVNLLSLAGFPRLPSLRKVCAHHSPGHDECCGVFRISSG